MHTLGRLLKEKEGALCEGSHGDMLEVVHASSPVDFNH